MTLSPLIVGVELYKDDKSLGGRWGGGEEEATAPSVVIKAAAQ